MMLYSITMLMRQTGSHRRLINFPHSYSTDVIIARLNFFVSTVLRVKPWLKFFLIKHMFPAEKTSVIMITAFLNSPVHMISEIGRMRNHPNT